MNNIGSANNNQSLPNNNDKPFVPAMIEYLDKDFKPFNLLIWILYLSMSLAFYICVAEPALNGLIDLRIWADAPLYEAVADTYDDILGLISIAGNFLGPVLIIKLFNNNYSYIYLVNCLILIVSFYLISKTHHINNSKFLFYLLINPMLFISLMSVNKEIVSLLFIALLLSYLNNKKTIYLLLCFFISFVVRWQLTLFLIIYLALTSPVLKMNTNRFKTLSIFILGISVIYILKSQALQNIGEMAGYLADVDIQGSGFFMQLNEIQMQYGYFVVFIPKIFQNLFGNITRIPNLLDWSDFYNNFIAVLQGILFIAMTLLLVLKHKLDLYDNVFYLAVIYCVLFAVSPIVQTRYFFIVSVLLAVILSRDQQTKAEGMGVLENLYLLCNRTIRLKS